MSELLKLTVDESLAKSISKLEMKMLDIHSLIDTLFKAQLQAQEDNESDTGYTLIDYVKTQFDKTEYSFLENGVYNNIELKSFSNGLQTISDLLSDSMSKLEIVRLSKKFDQQQKSMHCEIYFMDLIKFIIKEMLDYMDISCSVEMLLDNDKSTYEVIERDNKHKQYNEYLERGGTMSIEEWEKDGRYDPSYGLKNEEEKESELLQGVQS